MSVRNRGEAPFCADRAIYRLVDIGNTTVNVMGNLVATSLEPSPSMPS